MSWNQPRLRRARSVRHTGLLATALFVGMAGCDSLLDVELPGSITENDLYDPGQAPVLVTSAIADIECGYSDLIATNTSGNEDVFVRVTGWWGGAHEFDDAPPTTDCNTVDTSYGWWTPLHKGRYQAEQAYSYISDWDVANKDKLLAQSAIYAGIAYDVFGEYFCEMAFDNGPLMGPDEVLSQSEQWFTSALQHISASGDFALPSGISPSAQQMAYALRARVRWANGDNQGALADAMNVSQGFKAWVTRDGGAIRQRWNKTVSGNISNPFTSLLGPVDWWTGPGNWPAVIPFTGYRNLGILPNGRAITDDRYPITTAVSGAVADSRVPVQDMGRNINGFPFWTQRKYDTLDDDIPLANWEEIWLIRAEIEGGQAAIDLVNEIRAAHELPPVTYLSAGDAQGITNMIIEERRRSLFLEGRFWQTKIREDLWFPRGVGETPYPYSYQNAVRMVMPDNEFDLNPNLTPDMQGSMCGNQAPA